MKAIWSYYETVENTRKDFKTDNSPYHSKTNKQTNYQSPPPPPPPHQVMDQCVLQTMTYGCQTWSLNEQLITKLRTVQRAMETKMLNVKLQDKLPCADIRTRRKIINITEINETNMEIGWNKRQEAY